MSPNFSTYWHNCGLYFLEISKRHLSYKQRLLSLETKFSFFFWEFWTFGFNFHSQKGKYILLIIKCLSQLYTVEEEPPLGPLNLSAWRPQSVNRQPKLNSDICKPSVYLIQCIALLSSTVRTESSLVHLLGTTAILKCRAEASQVPGSWSHSPHPVHRYTVQSH